MGTARSHTIPNSEITIVSNLTRDWTQMAMHIGVDYSESSERVIGLLKEVGAELRGDPRFAESLVSDPEVPGIEKVSGSEVEYLMLVKTKPGQQYALTRELRRRIKECLQKNNIKPGSSARLYVLESSQTPASN